MKRRQVVRRCGNSRDYYSRQKESFVICEGVPAQRRPAAVASSSNAAGTEIKTELLRKTATVPIYFTPKERVRFQRERCSRVGDHAAVGDIVSRSLRIVASSRAGPTTEHEQQPFRQFFAYQNDRCSYVLEEAATTRLPQPCAELLRADGGKPQ